MYAVSIIEKFGGIRPMARKTNTPPSTIQRWAESGVIPKAKTQARVLQAAQKHGIDLSVADFFDTGEAA